MTSQHYYEYSFDFADPLKGSTLRTAVLENQVALLAGSRIHRIQSRRKLKCTSSISHRVDLRKTGGQ